MLFDLRGPGRRRVVQVVYLGLAVIIGVSLIGFGIGGSTGGGLIDAITGGKDSKSSSSVFTGRVKAAEASVNRDRRDPARWAALARARYLLASSGDGYDANLEQFTAEGKTELAAVSGAWQHYLSLNPKRPDDSLASLMVQAYGAGGLDKPDDAVAAQEILTVQRAPSSGLYLQLAELAYLAGQTRKGDLAGQKAEEIAPKDERAQIKSQVDSLKTQVAQAAAQAAQGATGTAGTTP